jgi:hypothetical protein
MRFVANAAKKGNKVAARLQGYLQAREAVADAETPKLREEAEAEATAEAEKEPPKKRGRLSKPQQMQKEAEGEAIKEMKAGTKQAEEAEGEAINKAIEMKQKQMQKQKENAEALKQAAANAEAKAEAEAAAHAEAKADASKNAAADAEAQAEAEAAADAEAQADASKKAAADAETSSSEAEAAADAETQAEAEAAADAETSNSEAEAAADAEAQADALKKAAAVADTAAFFNDLPAPSIAGTTWNPPAKRRAKGESKEGAKRRRQAAAREAPAGETTEGGTADEAPLETEADRKKNSEVQHRAQWTKYMRSLSSHAAASTDRSEKMPEELVPEIVTNKDRKHWYKIWCSCNKSWGQVKMSEEFVKVIRNKSTEVEGWLTQSQIVKLYASEMLAAELCKAKLSQAGMSKPHPEIPDVESARLFLVKISSTKTEEIDQMHKQGVKFEAALDKAGGDKIMQHMAAVVQPSTHPLPAIPDTPEPAVPATPEFRAPAEVAVPPRGDQGSQGDIKLPASVQRAINKANEVAKKAQEKADDIRKRKEEAVKKRLLDAEQKKASHEEEKRRKQAYLETPCGKAGTWVSNINADLQRIADCVADLKECKTKGMSDTMAVAWEATLQEHTRSLTTLRRQLEKMRDAGRDNGAVAKCSGIVESMKRDLKTCQLSVKAFKKA